MHDQQRQIAALRMQLQTGGSPNEDLDDLDDPSDVNYSELLGSEEESARNHRGGGWMIRMGKGKSGTISPEEKQTKKEKRAKYLEESKKAQEAAEKAAEEAACSAEAAKEAEANATAAAQAAKVTAAKANAEKDEQEAVVKAKEAAGNAKTAEDAARRAKDAAEAATEAVATATTALKAAEWAKYNKENAAKKAHKTKAGEEVEAEKKAQSSFLNSLMGFTEENHPRKAWEAQLATRRAARKAVRDAEAAENHAAQAQAAAKAAEEATAKTKVEN